MRRSRSAAKRMLARAAFGMAAAWVLAGCTAVQVSNVEPAAQVAQQARLPGSVYTGWRVYQDRCARCHGADAEGRADGGPDLLPRVRALGPRRFVNVVLQRYEWEPPPPDARSDGPAREAWLDEVMQRRAGALEMPAWGSEPRVQAHVVDLYAYLAARADGSQGLGRPAP